MSDFFNYKFKTHKLVRVEKNSISKNKCDLSILDGKTWEITSTSRGKEMMVIFTCGEEVHRMLFGFGRIGSISHCNINEIPEDFERNAQLRFYTETEIIYLNDFTRLSIWRWVGGFNKNRGPDIVSQHNEWRNKFYLYRKSYHLKKPVFDVIMDQRYFNGIGIYTRAEILARSKCSPFMMFNEMLESESMRNDFFEVCKEVLIALASAGGMQFKFWKNPFGMNKKRFNRYVICFNKPGFAFYHRDSKKRFFWFDKKFTTDYMLYLITNPKYANGEESVLDARLREKIYRYTENKS